MKNAWVKTYKPCQHPKIRLFCFPYAGGGASLYKKWEAHLPEDIELCAVQLPGREDRLLHAPIEDLKTLLEQMHDALVSQLRDIPFVFFGHSMGALIAYEYSLYLMRYCNLSPKHLVVSGRLPPDCPSPRGDIHHLPRGEFLNEIVKMGGTLQEVLEHEDLLDLLLPALRADFTLIERHKSTLNQKLDCPILIFGGDEDVDVPVQQLDSWQNVSSNDGVDKRIYQGGHFFLNSSYPEMIQNIVEKVSIRVCEAH